MLETLPRLHNHDIARLQSAATLLGGTAASGLVSFEGQPLYADRAWSPAHEFTYGSVIPALAESLEPGRPTRLDVLYDEFTIDASLPASEAYPEDYFLSLIAEAHRRQIETTPALPAHRARESDMRGRAETWIAELRDRGLARQEDGILRLYAPGTARPVALTARSGRPTCAVLDAAYQTGKSEQGIRVAVLAHSTDFVGQQRDMRAVLTAVHGGLPFDSLLNIFVRNRKDAMRLAGIRLEDSSGAVAELT